MNQIKIGVGFQVNKAGLNEIQDMLDGISVQAKSATGQLDNGLIEAAKTAGIVEKALNEAFNVNLDRLNISKFNQELNKSGITVQKIQQDFSKAGIYGANAFNLLATKILQTNVQLKQSNKLLDEMATSMANTVKWGVTSSIFNNMASSVQKAYGYVKKLDGALTDIRIVTDKSAESMEKFAQQANQAAKGLGASTLDYAEASLIYYQQGLSDEEVAARASTTLKAANVTGQAGDEVSEQLTAVWNGYKVSAQETELYIDKLAAVAADTSADLEELSTGMSKVASAANVMGVDIDSLNAQLATVISVTRESPETIGTAFKTIYARMGDIEAGLDTETTLGTYTSEMEKMGFNVLDANGKLKDMREVVEEIGNNWNKLTKEQQLSLAQTMAGTRQYSRLLSLFDNWDMYQKALNTSVNSMGTLQKQQDIYMESTQAHLQQLRTTLEGVYTNLIDTKELNIIVDVFDNAASVIENFTGSLGGGAKTLTGLGIVIANIFNKQIASGINNAMNNSKRMAENAALYQRQLELMQNAQTAMRAGNVKSAESESIAAGYEKQIEYTQRIHAISKTISEEELNHLNTLAAQSVELEKQKIYNEESLKFLMNQANINKDEQYLNNILAGEVDIDSSIDNLTTDISAINKNLKETEQLYKKILTINESNLSIKDKEKKLQDLGIKLENGQKATKDSINKLIFESLRQTEDKLNTDKAETKELEKQLRFYQEAQKAATQNMTSKTQQQALDAEINTIIEQESRSADVLAKVTTISSSLSSIAMSWMSVTSLMQTWNDDAASFGDKMLQTMMTLGMVVPSLVSSFKQFGEVFGVNTSLLEVYNKKKAVFNSLEIQGNVISKTTEVNKFLEAKATLAVAGAENADNMSKKEKIKHLLSLNKEQLIHIGLTEKEADSVLKAKVAQDAWNTSMLANPIMWVVAALAALVAGLAFYNEQQKKNKEQEIELNKANIEKLEAMQAEREENNKLFDSYMQLYDGYKQGTTAKEDMASAADAVCKALNIERDIVGNLAGDYTNLTEEIIKAQKAAYEQQLQEAKDKKRAYATNAFTKITQTGLQSLGDAFFGGGSSTANNNQLTMMFELGGLLGYGELDEFPFLASVGTLLNSDNKGKYNKITPITTNEAMAAPSADETYVYGLSMDLTNVEDIVLLYDFLNQLDQLWQDQLARNVITGEEYIGSEVVDSIKEYIEILKEDLDKYKETENEIKLINSKLGVVNTDFATNNFSEFLENRKNLINDAAVDGSTAKDVDEYILKTTPSQEFFIQKAQAYDQLMIKYKEDSNEVFELINELDEASLKAFNRIGTSPSTFSEFKTLLKKTIAETAAEEAQIKIDAIISLSDVILKGELTEEEKQKFQKSLGADFLDWDTFGSKSIIQQLDLLSQKIKDLAVEQISQTEKITRVQIENLEEQLKNAEERLKTLRESEDEDVIGYDILEEEAIEEEIKRLTALLRDSFEELDFNINTSILETITDQVDILTKKMSALSDVSSLIGEGFKVAPEDVATLYNLYPQLLENAEILADGTAALNKETVDTILKGNSIILNDDYTKTEEQLQNQITLLQSEIDATDTKIQNLKNGLLNEEDISKLEQELADAEAINEIKNVDEIKKAEKDATAQAVTSSKTSTEIIDQNLKNIGERIAEVSQAYSRMLSGKVVEYNPKELKALGADELQYRLEENGDFESDTYIDSINDNDEITSIEERTAAIIAKLEEKRNALSIQQSAYITQLSKLRARWSKYQQEQAGTGSGDGRNEALKRIEDEIDRYWELNKAIEAIEEKISDLEKIQDNLFGKELISNLQQVNKLLGQQEQAYAALAAEQKIEAEELRLALAGFGVNFDTEGGIANYLEASMAALDKYNMATIDYNASGDETTYAQAQANYEYFKELMSRYEELYYSEMIETQNKIDEIQSKAKENTLQAWEIELELQLDLSEAERDWNDFIKDINNDFKSITQDTNAELQHIFTNLGTYTLENGTLMTDIESLKEVIAEINNFKAGGTSEMYESMTQAQEKLKELLETTQEDAKAAFELYENAWDTFIDGIEQSAEQFEELMEQFERVDKELEYQGELIQLLYGEEAYGLLNELYNAQEKNSTKQLSSLKEQRDMWHMLWEQETENTDAKQKYYELWTEAQENLNSKVVEHIELLKTNYMNTVNDVLKTLESGLTGGSLDDLADEWDRIQEKSDKYLDSVESLYEIQTLANRISDSINATTTLKNQQKLQDLYNKEIEYLREKENLTQYDLDAAEARYQIALKEIALEDAQNAKNSMKLTRGADGNWSYQYVADEDNIADKQQELTEAYNNLYQLSKDAYDENLESLSNLQEKYLESYRTILENDILSTEEKQQRIDELQNQYFENYKLLAEENTLLREDLATSSASLLIDLYNQDESNYAAMTEKEKALTQELFNSNVKSFMDLEAIVKGNYAGIGDKASEVMSQTLLEWQSGAQQIADLWNANDGKSVKDQILNAEQSIWEALDEYEKKVDEVADAVAADFSEEGITDAIKQAEAATRSLVTDTVTQLENYRSLLETIEEMWVHIKGAVVEATNAAKVYAGEEPTPPPADNSTDNTTTDNTTNDTNTGGDAGNSLPGGGDGELKVGDMVTYTGGPYYHDSYGSSPAGTRGPGKQVKVTIVKDDNRPFPIHVESSDSAYGWLRKDQLTGYDTGGYTGEWNNSGKLALLHQKEIVLNAKDTKNLLDAVQTVRDISKLSSSIEETIMRNLSSMILRMTNFDTHPRFGSQETARTTENVFHVTAEFPNANDVTSIKEAFLSLPNIVSQYISENKK